MEKKIEMMFSEQEKSATERAKSVTTFREILIPDGTIKEEAMS